MKSIIKTLTVILAAFTLQIGFAQDADHSMMKDKMMKDAPTVISLEQTPGQYETQSLDLTAGTYVFEVTNRNVDKDLGFYLTPTSDAKAQVPNSGLAALVGKGQTAKTGVVTLAPGTYQYSCPLNPTPHYTITVTEK